MLSSSLNCRARAVEGLPWSEAPLGELVCEQDVGVGELVQPPGAPRGVLRIYLQRKEKKNFVPVPRHHRRTCAFPSGKREICRDAGRAEEGRAHDLMAVCPHMHELTDVMFAYVPREPFTHFQRQEDVSQDTRSTCRLATDSTNVRGERAGGRWSRWRELGRLRAGEEDTRLENAQAGQCEMDVASKYLK
ncbi:hypothetical protein FA95DRAFT_1399954 [Auriscalpium vulgare]|uniref:Uncharacterized protein n=1 Tax=Auriscalpium vulgare TaxID=40419 RepID=A0ACB8RQ03_9AGAM|nr:hypothetical protein FA95DRAFT_1399954 [Auriscalpium vulgare]